MKEPSKAIRLQNRQLARISKSRPFPQLGAKSTATDAKGAPAAASSCNLERIDRSRQQRILAGVGVRGQEPAGWLRNQRIVAVERMLIGGVVTILQAGQQSG